MMDKAGFCLPAEHVGSRKRYNIKDKIKDPTETCKTH